LVEFKLLGKEMYQKYNYQQQSQNKEDNFSDEVLQEPPNQRQRIQKDKE